MVVGSVTSNEGEARSGDEGEQPGMPTAAEPMGGAGATPSPTSGGSVSGSRDGAPDGRMGIVEVPSGNAWLDGVKGGAARIAPSALKA